MHKEPGQHTVKGSEMLSAIEANVADVLRAHLTREGLSPSRADALATSTGKDVAERLRMDFAGQHVYVPLDRVRRNTAIFEACNGKNHHELASRFHMSVAAIYRILKTEGERRRHKQVSLFDVTNR